ncbi:MAG: NAD-dependent epimerase/dehydratase family protein, partial [Ideonella sp.]|nr:NAD-dependent epimerase/dehydratase family protein [Ideonella sp.]
LVGPSQGRRRPRRWSAPVSTVAPPRARRILVTGGDGFLGRSLLAALADRPDTEAVVALDVREVPPERRRPGISYRLQDVRDQALADTLREHAIDTVVHLASIVTPGRDSNRAFEYDVDVNGTRHVLEACIASGVKHLLVSSSGAAYGYHADNPAWLHRSSTRCAATKSSPTPTTSAWSRRCWRSSAASAAAWPKPCYASAPSWASGWTTKSPPCLKGPACSPCAAATAPLSSSGTKTWPGSSCMPSIAQHPAATTSRATAR